MLSFQCSYRMEVTNLEAIIYMELGSNNPLESPRLRLSYLLFDLWDLLSYFYIIFFQDDWFHCFCAVLISIE